MYALHASVRTVNSLKQDQRLMFLSMLHGASLVLCGPQGPGTGCDYVYAGIHLTLGSNVCFVALDKNRISVFPVTHCRKTWVLLAYYKDKYFPFTHTCTHVRACVCVHHTHVSMHRAHISHETISYRWQSVSDLWLFLTPLYF